MAWADFTHNEIVDQDVPVEYGIERSLAIKQLFAALFTTPTRTEDGAAGITTPLETLITQLQASGPIDRGVVQTSAEGTAFTLSDAAQALVDGDETTYAVALHHQAANAAYGALGIKAGTKTATGFTVEHIGSLHGGDVLVLVYLVPGS